MTFNRFRFLSFFCSPELSGWDRDDSDAAGRNGARRDQLMALKGRGPALASLGVIAMTVSRNASNLP